jgi:hypothetical protein
MLGHLLLEVSLLLVLAPPPPNAYFLLAQQLPL